MLEEFNENGFVVVDIEETVFIKQFNEGLGSLLQSALKKHNLSCDDIFNEGFIKLDEVDHYEIHKIYNILRNSNILSSLVNSNSISSAIKTLLDLDEDQPFYNMYNICRMDPPGDEKFILNWHQETYSTIPDTKSLQLWAPMINPNNEENGSIDVLVGSHKEGVIKHYLEETKDGYVSFKLKESQISDIAKYERITVDLKPGQFLLFHPNLIHKSNFNKGSKVRYSLVSHLINPFDENFDILSNNEIIRLNRKRCINAENFEDLINQEKQTYY